MAIIIISLCDAFCMPLSLHCRLLCSTCKTWLEASRRFSHSKRMQPSKPNWRKQLAVTKRLRQRRPSSTHAQSAEPRCQTPRLTNSTLRVSTPSNHFHQNYKLNDWLCTRQYNVNCLFDCIIMPCMINTYYSSYVAQCCNKLVHSLG